MCTVVLSFLPYTTGKQQPDEEMPKIRNFRSINRYQRDNLSRFKKIYKTQKLSVSGVFLLSIIVLSSGEKQKILYRNGPWGLG